MKKTNKTKHTPTPASSLPRDPGRFGWLWPLALFVAVVILLARPYDLFSALLTPVDSDLTLALLPAREWFFGAMRQFGQFPLWNSLLIGGVPVAEAVQTAIYYPPVWLHAVMPPTAAANLLIIGHLLAAAAAMAICLRILGTKWSGATAAGMIYAFSGFAILRMYAGHINFLFAMPWAPLVCGALYRLSARLGEGPVLWGAICFGMILLCGNLQIPFMACMIFLLFGIVLFGRLIIKKSQGEVEPVGPLRFLACAAAMAVMGGVLGAAQWVPAWQWLPQTVRGEALDPQYYSDFTMRPVLLLGLIFPRLLGPIGRGATWFGWENLAPLGTMVITLGAVGACLCFRKRLVSAPVNAESSAPHPKSGPCPRRVGKWLIGFFIALFFLGILLSFGAKLPFYNLLSDLLPPLRSFRNPGRFLYISTFAASVLAGIGVDFLAASPAPLRLRYGKIVLFWSGILVILYVLLFYPSGFEGDHWQKWTGWRMEEAKAILSATPFVGPQGDELTAWQKEQFGLMRHDVFKAIALMAAAGMLLVAPFLRGRYSYLLGPALVMLITVDLLDYGMDFTQKTPVAQTHWSSETNALLKDKLGAQWRLTTYRPERDMNFALAGGLRSASAYEPMVPRDVLRMWNLDQDDDPDYPQAFVTMVQRTPWLNRNSVKYALFASGMDGEKLGWRRLSSVTEGDIYENSDALPRARFMPRAVQAASLEDALLKMQDPAAKNAIFLMGEDLKDTKTLPNFSKEVTGTDTMGAATRLGEVQELTITLDTPRHVKMKGTFPAPGYAILADTMAEGWKAEISNKPAPILMADGTGTVIVEVRNLPAPILRADGTMRAVAVKAGENEITFTYTGTKPAQAARWASLGMLVILGIGIGVVTQKKKNMRMELQ